MKLDYKITFSDTVFAQEVNGEMVLLDTDSENHFGLDEVGTSIWQVNAREENAERGFGGINGTV